jgi:rRNA maturation protein Nop10
VVAGRSLVLSVSYCPKCGKKVPLEFGACPSCGQTLHLCHPTADSSAQKAQRSRRDWFDYSNAFIIAWAAALFVSFGLISDLVDRYGLLYNIGQGLFIALFAGAVLLLVRRLARARPQGISN